MGLSSAGCGIARGLVHVHSCLGDEVLKLSSLVRVLCAPAQQCVLAPAPAGKSWKVCGEVSSVMVTAAAAPYISSNVAMWVAMGDRERGCICHA